MDEAKFRAAAKAEGYSDAEIDAHLGKTNASAPPKDFGKWAEKEGEKASAEIQKHDEARTPSVGGISVPEWLLPAAGVGAVGLGMYGAKKALEPSTPQTTAVEPTLDIPQTPAGPTEPTFEETVAAKRAAKQASAIGSFGQPRPVAEPSPVQALQDKLASVKSAAPVAPVAPTAPVVPEATPQVTQALAGAAIPPVQAPASPVETPPVVPKGRPTKAQAAAAKAQLDEMAKNAPEGMRPLGPNNLAPGEKIGAGGYTYANARFGPETSERWVDQYGEKNVPYKDVVKDISAADLGPTPKGVEPPAGKYTRPQYIPKFIQGMAMPEFLGKLSLGGLGALGAAHAIKKGMQTGDWNDLGELGAYLAAGSSVPATAALMASGAFRPVGESQEDLDKFQQKMDQIKKVGAGRGIAPPEAYKR